jgi:vacuolar iron transporter family protein
MKRRHTQSLRRHWYQEKQSAWLYRTVAAREPNRRLQRLFRILGRQAEAQAATWASQLTTEAGPPPVFRPSTRARILARLVRWFGVRPLRPALAAMKVRGLSAYSDGHLDTRHPMPVSPEDVGQRHRGLGGGNLRAAVFGANDGLLSNTSLILGMAGAETDSGMLLMAGIAGLLAGALSMAAGEYISMRSQRELYEHQIDLERAELALYPEQEAEELAVIYAARGMVLSDARRATRDMMKDPEQALDLLAREELGLNPNELGSPFGAAAFSFISFAIGASIPLAPFLFQFRPGESLKIAIALAGTSLFTVGAVLSLFTGRSALWGGLRMLLIGAAAGTITYAIGRGVGVQLD